MAKIFIKLIYVITVAGSSQIFYKDSLNKNNDNAFLIEMKQDNSLEDLIN